MNANKKIVLLTPGFPADENDSTCTTYLQDLVLSYKEYYPHAKIEVITFQYPHKEKDYLWHGVKVYSAGGANSKFLSRWLTWRKVLKRLEKINAEGKIDVIHSFWLTECTYIAQQFCNKHKIQHVASIMGQDVKEENKYLSRIDLEKVKVVGIAHTLASKYFKLKNRRVNAIIPFGVDTKKMIRKANVTRDIDVLGVGALSSLKNYSMFIEVVLEVRKKFPDIKAKIVGEGEEKSKLKKMIIENGLQSNIELIGEIPHTQVFEMMNRSKILLHTSSFEGQSMVISEALYAGAYVLCFDVVRATLSEKILICNNKQIMIMTLRQLLKEKMDHSAADIQTTQQAADQYFELYG